MRQLSALSRISKYLYTKSESVLYHSFIASNLNYCPIVWRFCRVINNNKLAMIQESSLHSLRCLIRVLSFDDHKSNVHDLQDSIGGQTLALRRLKFMSLEIHKYFKKVNALCLHNSCNTNTILFKWERQSCNSQNNEVWTENIFFMSDPFYGIVILNDHGDNAHHDFN